MAIAVLCLLSMLLPFPFAQATTNDPITRAALTEFKRKIVGAGQEQLLGSWQVNNSSASYCNWEGVLCHDSGLAISLPRLGLQGTIAPALSNLASLLFLDLSSNAISGGIPPLPLGLRSLSLGFNNLTGPLPPLLGNLSSLWHLSLEGNMLEGPLPPQLGKLSSLWDLSLDGNRLDGPLPPQLGNLSNLQTLSLGGNRLEGPLPLQLGNLFQLGHLSLEGNRLEGPLPPQLGNLSYLRHLSLEGNRLDGPLPPQLGNLSYLGHLSLEGNRLDGPLPLQLGNLSNLQSLSLGGNRLEGPLPPQLGNLSYLEHLSLGGNRLEGPLPPQLGKLSSLRYLSLEGNRLEGPLPLQLSNLSYLQHLSLEGNRLDGTLPLQLGNLSSLQYLHLQGNALQGTIPESLGVFLHLKDVDLSYNNFSGSIPLGWLTRPIHSVTNLALSHNSLNGAIPSKICALHSAQVFDFSHNKLEGTIPATIVQCNTLQTLNLSHNNLQGQIPAALGQISSLVSLDLSANNFIGKIPTELANVLNVTAGSFADNPGLCGPPLASLCPALAQPNFKNNSRSTFVIIFCGTSASLLMICCATFAWCKKYGAKRQLHQDSWRFWALRITAKELETATGGFSEGNLIGRGGTSKVYKATLQDGRVVAVKKFNREGNLKNIDYFFRKECETLGKMRHRNLVRILSTCCNLEMKALVLEYMPNGSLEKLLFESEDYHLNWRRLVGIALDVAQALVYMHHEFDVPVIHCDLKPSNILLDKFYTAHVSDFGIARLLSHDDDIYSASYFRGSIGYIAPECAQVPHYSMKGDIYSYGVVLLCMLTGRQPTSDVFYEQGVDMPRWVKCFWPDRYMEALHPTLRLEVETINMQEKEVLRHVMEVALCCTMQARKDRPTSKEVLRRLSPFKSSPRHLQ